MAGRPRDLNTVDLECLRELIETRKTRRLRKITSMFAGLYVDISMSTIYRRMREPIDDGGLGFSLCFSFSLPSTSRNILTSRPPLLLELLPL